MNNEEICQRFDHLESERRGSVEQIWDLIERFILPLRGDFYTTLNQEGEVDWHRRDIYDSTAIFACQSLAASLQGNLTSPAQKWFDLRYREDEMNDDDAAMEWLEECSDRIFNALHDANFDIEIAEGYLDLCGFGTSVLTEEIDEETGGLIFSAIPVKEAFFEEDHNKQVTTLYRRIQWTPVQILTKFGEEGTPSDIKERAENPSSATTRETVIFCIYPRSLEAGIEPPDPTKPIAPTKRPFGYKYIHKNSKQLLGEEGGYYEMPAFVSRWRKTSGSRWGHSPGTVALSDILTLNQIKEATLEAAGKAIDPANLTEEGNIVGDLDLDRGGLTVVSDLDGLRPYESGTRFDVSNIEIAMLTESIRKAFYQDQLELKESPAMTATEVNVRYELMQRLLGPTLGRLKTDLLDPLIKRTFNLLLRSGQLPEIPEGMPAANMDIEYNGPLPRAQQAETAMAIRIWLEEIAALSEMYPQARDLPDVDKAFRMMAQLRGVPSKVTRSEEEIQEDRDAREAQMTQQAATATAAAEGEAMQSVGKGAQELNAADTLGAQQTLQKVANQ